MFSHAYLNKAAGQKFVTQHIQFIRIPEQECVLIIISHPDSYRDRDQVLAPYTPGGGGCQRFTEPVLSPLLYNSNLLALLKGIFEFAKIIEFIDL